MADEKKKYRFLFIQPFQLSTGGKFVDKYHSAELSKEQRLRMDYLNIRHLLEDVEWDFHGGPTPPYGDWAVETREEPLTSGESGLRVLRVLEAAEHSLVAGGAPVVMPLEGA